MKKRFFYKTGFIWERTARGDKVIAAFAPNKPSLAKRITRLLNAAYETEQFEKLIRKIEEKK